MATHKSTVEEIRARFDADVERFSNLDTGQAATVDAALCMALVAQAAAATTPQAKAVLDLGCGAGNYSLKLRELLPDARFTLVDLSVPMLERARARLGPAAAEVRPADIRSLEFADHSFDVILAAAVLHHLRTAREWEEMFGRLHRWLAPGGSVWIFDLVTHDIGAIQQLLWSRYGQYLEGLGGAAYREKVFQYIEAEDTPVSLGYQLDLLRRSGFQSIDVLHKNSCFAAFGARK
ncbi:MAG TPA: class I SAM-dependent methyltransferase [Opitutaceae bacterium]|nr:class I SAM-dependent methyltransferase [Opitutaceae bacterium]